MSHNYHCLLLDKHLESDTICFMTEGCFDQETKDRSHFLSVFLDLVLLKRTLTLVGTKSVHFFFVLLNAYFFLVDLPCFFVWLHFYIHRDRGW